MTIVIESIGSTTMHLATRANGQSMNITGPCSDHIVMFKPWGGAGEGLDTACGIKSVTTMQYCRTRL